MAETDPHIEQFMSAAMKSYLNSLAETSRKQYITNFNKFSSWVESQTENDEPITFEVDDLKAYFEEMHEENLMKCSTIKCHLSQLKVFFEYGKNANFNAY